MLLFIVLLSVVGRAVPEHREYRFAVGRAELECSVRECDGMGLWLYRDCVVRYPDEAELGTGYIRAWASGEKCQSW